MAESYALVQRDQCNGRTMSCVNCGKPLGDQHDILCYGYAIARTAARRAAEQLAKNDPEVGRG